MKSFRTFAPMILVSIALVLPSMAQHATVTPPADASVSAAKQWADEIWLAAKSGDRAALSDRLQTMPDEAAELRAATRFRDSLALHKSNEMKAMVKRDEAREKAVAEMREHATAGDLSKALRAAVTVQTLGENMEDAFQDPEIMKIIEWAERRIPEVEAESDWLSAQELLFFLRTLYEDTNHAERYTRYRDELDAVNRRVSLLAQYAPSQLHDLRAKRAERLGETPLGEYKHNPSNDWQERSKEVRPDMLKAALRTAATEHIDASGWKPLLEGGLNELRLLATTASLDETFPNLRQPELVSDWVKHIESELTRVERQYAVGEEFDSWKFTELLDNLIRTNERTIKLPEQVLYREFGDGALYELDEFSEIVWPDRLSRFKQATEGAFVGVGILIKHNDTQEIVVVNPLEGTPAYFGGVKPNDTIVTVEGEPTVGWSLNDAVDRITGAPNTNVTLGLKREGEEGLVTVTLRRDVIKLRSVMGWWKRDLRADGTPEWDWFIDPVTRIAYIKLTQFTEESHNDLLLAWNEINTNGKPAGLILDLRFNPGGLLTSAVSISNLFVKQGVIVTGEDKDQKPAWRPQRADPLRARITDVPIVVLINQGSASASEIVSGCLQAHGAAVIVGERSFGKGSVQTVHPTAVNARLKLTTQYYRLPAREGEARGRLVHKRPGETVWGVDPDIIVKMTPEQVRESQEVRQAADIIPQDEAGKLVPNSPDRPDVTTLLSEGLDPQLETALLILQARALGDSAAIMRHAMNSN